MTELPGFSPQEMGDRLGRIRAAMAELGMGALLSRDAANVRYATGFRGEPRTLLITGDEVVLFTSFRTLRWAEEQTGVLGDQIELSVDPLAVEEIGRRLGDKPMTIGVDLSISHRSMGDLQKQLAPHKLEAAGAIERARQIKSPAEISILRESQRINEGIFSAILSKVRPGMTERAVQGLILAEMAGNEDVDLFSFVPIVASGPNAWEIHHLPDQTQIQPDTTLLIDLGVIHQGYASDMTRTVCLGPASEEIRDIYQIVGAAQEAAIAAMRPGVSTRYVDQIARDIISDAGHGKTFTHGLGHSIGLETHDPGPNLSATTPEAMLQPGMAFTVEPGIYLEDRFGVRTEDVVIITEDGQTNITMQPSSLLELEI